jgi:transposase-like protein
VGSRFDAFSQAGIVSEVMRPGAKVTEIARRHGLSRNLLYTWRREAGRAAALGGAASPLPDLVPFVITDGADAPIATEAPRRIADLYAIEAEIRGRSAGERRNVRQDRTKPLVQALKTWMEVKLAAVSQKGKVAAALRYALSRWVGLSRFLDDGRSRLTPMSSNAPFARSL